MDPTPRPAARQASVPILLDEPDRPYRSIALVEVTGLWAGLRRMGRRLASEAAKLGGDAVLLSRRSSHSRSTVLPLGDSYVQVDSDDSRLVGRVIVYLTP